MNLKINTALLLLVPCSAAFAVQPLQQEFLAELDAKTAHTETIVCDFVQLRHNSMLARDAESSGSFRFKRPGNLALNYDRPAGDRIVMSETDFLVVTQGSRSVVKIASNPMYTQLQQIFAACFSGDVSALTSDGEFLCERTAAGYIVQIVPRSKRARRYVSRIVLTFSAKDMLLDELRMSEPSGDYTLYRFTNRRTNLPVPDSYFDCTR